VSRILKSEKWTLPRRSKRYALGYPQGEFLWAHTKTWGV
jgi:hypothetical protein